MWRIRIVGVVGLIVLGSLPLQASGAAAPEIATIDRAATVNQPAVRGERFEVGPIRSDPAFPETDTYQFGTSVQGRPLIAYHRKGSPVPTRRVLVFGVIHGDEHAGRLVTDQLMTVALPADLDLWIVSTINPDGEVVGSHQNAHSVDLNRNFPANWETGTYYSSGKYYSGPGAASEPETRATMTLVEMIEPDVTIWYHQPFDRVDCDENRVGATCTNYAAAVGSYSALAMRPGTETDWIMTAGHGKSFVFEFSSATPPAATVAKHVAAVLALRLS